MANEELTLRKVRLDALHKSTNWNRQKVDDLKSMVVSIKAVGLIYPLLVKPLDNKPNEFEIIDGHRRFLAMREANISETLVYVTIPGVESEVISKGLIANLRRQANSPLEISSVLQHLVTHGQPIKEISRICGMTMTQVSQYLSLQKLPLAVQKVTKKYNFEFSVLRELSRLNDEQDQAFITKILSQILAKNLTSDALRILISNYKQKQQEAATGKNSTKGKKKGRPVKYPYEFADYSEEQLKPRPAGDLLKYINNTQTKLQATRTPYNQRYLQGITDGLAIAAGLKDPL